MIWLFPSGTDFREIATVSVYRDVFAMTLSTISMQMHLDYCVKVCWNSILHVSNVLSETVGRPMMAYKVTVGLSRST